MAITANNSGSNHRDRIYGRMYTPAANIFSSSITIPSEVILYVHNHNYTRKSKDVQESVELGPPPGRPACAPWKSAVPPFRRGRRHSLRLDDFMN